MSEATAWIIATILALALLIMTPETWANLKLRFGRCVNRWRHQWEYKPAWKGSSYLHDRKCVWCGCEQKFTSSDGWQTTKFDCDKWNSRIQAETK